jgi:hypothetical protein
MKDQVKADMSELLNYKVTKADLMELMESTLRKKYEDDYAVQRVVVDTVRKKVLTLMKERDKELTKRGTELIKSLKKSKPKATWSTRIVIQSYKNATIVIHSDKGDRIELPMTSAELATVKKYNDDELSIQLKKELLKSYRICNARYNVKEKIQDISAKITHDAIMSSDIGRQILAKFKIPVAGLNKLIEVKVAKEKQNVACKKVTKKKAAK